jgi:hypothetical protein
MVRGYPGRRSEFPGVAGTLIRATGAPRTVSSVAGIGNITCGYRLGPSRR